VANINDAFPIKNGLSLDDIVGVFCGENDPAANSEVAPVGSIYLRHTGGGVGELWVKVGTANNEWEQLQSGSGVSVIDDLDDVDTSTNTPVDGDKLIWDATGGNWIPESSAPPTLPVESSDFLFSYDTTTQTTVSINTWQDVTFSVNGDIDGWIHIPGTAEFTAPRDGRYAATVEFNVEKNSGGNVQCEIRSLFNGIEIAGSHNGMDITSNNTAFSLSRTFLFNATNGQDFNVQFAANNLSARIIPPPSPAGAITSVSATLTIRRLT
jgi:hypothetical protein